MKVTFEDIVMAYDEKEVLHNLNFTIPNDSLVSILGPSGCGKSTTLMLLSGLIFPTKGKIYFDDKEVTKQDAVKRKVGMVFQNYALYPHLNVLDNIMFPLKMAKMPKKERRERAMELARLVQIEDHIDKKPKQLSGGQQQRVAIARALAKQPDILLMDEPLSNLDARLRLEMREEIRRIQKETKITTVFVTHDQEEALSISDYVMVLNNGNIQQDSAPQTLYEKPNNVFVATFLGNPIMNIFTPDSSDFKWPENLPAEVKTIGIRSEHFNVVADEREGIFSGQVSHIERVGKNTTVKVVSGETQVVVSDIAVHFEEGQHIFLNAQLKDMHFFDAKGNVVQVGAAVW